MAVTWKVKQARCLVVRRSREGPAGGSIPPPVQNLLVRMATVTVDITRAAVATAADDEAKVATALSEPTSRRASTRLL